MQDKKISSIEELINEVSHDIGNYNITQVQNTEEYKFGLACYKVFGKELGQITKEDIETKWADGRGDGGIDLMYITEEDEKSVLNVCQAKYGQNVDNNTITEAFNKMITTFNNLKKKINHHHYSERLKKVTNEHIDDEYEDVKFVVFVNVDLPKKTTNNIKTKFSDKNIEIYTLQDILDEMHKHQEQPDFVAEDKIDKEGSYLEMGFGERAKDGIVINAKASSLWSLYDKYHNHGLFEQNLRYFTAKRNVDNPIVESIRSGGKDFWFHNNGIIIACKDYYNDGSNVKLQNFSIINGCQTVSLIGKHWANNGIPDKDKDFTVLCKIIKPKEGEKYDDFVREIARSANNQKPIQVRDLKSNDKIQKKLANEFGNELQYLYEYRRGQNHNKNQLPKKITNTDFGLIVLSFFCQKPGTARNGKTKIFSNETLYKEIFHNNFNYKTIGQLLLLWEEVLKAIGKIDQIAGDTDGYAKDFLNNGKYFVLAALGHMLKKAFNTEDLWQIDTIFINPMPDDIKAILDDIIRDIALCIGEKYENIRHHNNEKITSMANFLKTDTKYNKFITNAIDSKFFKSEYHINQTKELMRHIFDVN